ncbi:MAG: SdrD B-like domain-containing protein, partial [Tepidisphaeraceae bacterium]
VYDHVTIGSTNVKRDFRPKDVAKGIIRGTVFVDSNHNGVKDGAEVGIAGLLVYIDYNKNGVRNSGEKYARTNSVGNYSLNPLPGGTYRVRETVPSGYTLSLPSSGYFEIKLSNGQIAGGRNFANVAQAHAATFSFSLISPGQSWLWSRDAVLEL